MRVLGIETSCDETGVAIYDTAFTGGQGLLSDALYSQIAMHAEYGGVVPELASRDHTRKLLPLIEQVLKDANLTRQDLDGIAYTAGPGLVGALMVGASTAHGMAKALNIPVLGVHHMEGHLLAPMLEDDAPEFPFVALLVSGGHTQLVEVQGWGTISYWVNQWMTPPGRLSTRPPKCSALLIQAARWSQSLPNRATRRAFVFRAQ